MIDDLRAGAIAVSPVLLGIIPFGVAVGVVNVEAGYGIAEAIDHSTMIFAGASQIAAIDLLADGTAPAVVVLTVLVINLRMLMYGASLAPHLAEQSLRRRAFGAYALTDQAFAMSIDRYREPMDADSRYWFFLGTAVSLWLPWQLATVAGAIVGGAIPDSVPLGFAVPITFLALLVPAMTDRATVAAATTSALVATVGAGLPSNLGMLLGALSGIAVGTVVALTNRTGR